MPEQTTPATREPQQPLSLVDHLRTTLYNLKAQHTRVQDAIDGYRSAATPDDEYRDLLTSCERTVEQLEQQITAQEQTIAILSVLMSPKFAGIDYDDRHNPPLWSVIGLDRWGDPRPFAIETGALEALLEADAAFKEQPQEGATSGKESTDADTV